MLQQVSKANVDTTWTRGPFENKQPRRLVLALALLLVALVGILVRDRQFWFGTGESADSDVIRPEVAAPAVAKSAPVTTSPSLPIPPTKAKKPVPVAKTAPAPEPTAPASNAVTATRTVLPPLDVEVVAGDSHHKLHPGSNATRVEITRPGSTAPAPSIAQSGAAVNAADRERMSASAPQAKPAPRVQEGSIEAAYPPLAQQMKVEGSVVLQAVISADGAVQDLRVLSGPGILVSAAQQAVRQWKFKPVMVNGQPVETQAKITVNFTIKVTDNAPKNT
jgi:protein TonB